jgi:hypothetical protein
MNIKPIVWLNNPQQYSNERCAMIEQIKIGSVGWDSMLSRDSTEGRYKAYFNLPGYKQPKENFKTEEEGKQWVEDIFRAWIKKITIEE